MAKETTVKEFKKLIKEEALKLYKKTLLENEKKKLIKELGEMEGDKPFSSFLTTKANLEPKEGDDPGDFAGGTLYAYKIPKTSNFSRDTEEEMYDMLLDMFGRGENRGPGQKYTRMSYDIEDHGNYWFVKIIETTGYDI